MGEKLEALCPELVGRVVTLEITKSSTRLPTSRVTEVTGVLLSYSKWANGDITARIEGSDILSVFEAEDETGISVSFTVTDQGDTASNRILANMLDPNYGCGVRVWNSN